MMFVSTMKIIFHRRRLTWILAALLCSAFFTAAPASAAEPAQIESTTGQLSNMIRRWRTDREALERFYNASLLPARMDRLETFYAQWRDRLATIDFNQLHRDNQIDYLLFRNQLDYALKDLSHQREQWEQIQPMTPFASMIVELEWNRLQLKAVNPQQAAQTLADLSLAIDEARQSIEASLKTSQDTGDSDGDDARRRIIAYRAANRLRRLKQTLEQWYDFSAGYDPLFTWWCKQPYGQASKNLGEYADFLVKKIVGVADESDGPLIGDPIGAEALADELAHEMIDMSPQALIVLGEREFAWCEDQMRRAAVDLGFADEDWRDAMEQVKSKHVQPGQQDDLIKAQALEAIAFVQKHDMVTVPPICAEIWRIEMMSPKRQLVNPYFVYNRGGIDVSYPTDKMTHQAKLMSMRGNNRHFTRAVTHHELIPGHHLQSFMAARHRTYRRPFQTPFLVEGWALHWEMLLWDMGFAQSPEDRIGMLFWRMHRAARIIISLKFHLGEMTPEDMVDFLVNRVGHERDGAMAEVRRYINGSYGPLYQCAYMVGGLQLRALHKELVSSGAMTPRDFHDAVLKQNAVPIAMIRAALTDQPLSEDAVQMWRFQEAVP